MNFVIKKSIDTKLGSIFLKAIIFCLLVTCFGFFSTLLYYSGSSFKQELSSISSIAAATSRASLVFDDPKAGERVLSGLRAKESIVYAGLYKSNGEIVSEYGKRPHNLSNRTSVPENEVFKFSWINVELTSSVVLDGEVIGWLVIVSSLTNLYQQLFICLLIAGTITLVAALGAYHFRSVLRRLVSQPIISLRDFATEIALTKNFSARIKESNDEIDEITQLASTFNDMLEQLEERNQALLQAKNRAEEADQLKSIFLATVSHELRTPIHAMLGMTEELQNTEVSLEQKELLDVVSSSGALLISIINDILDFSKIEAGKLVLSPSVTNLQEHLLKVLRMFEGNAKKKGLELSISVESQIPTLINVDAGRLAQILVNLVGNALKFTNSGSISVSVRKSQSYSRKGHFSLTFSVTDTGIGIEESSLKLIFDSFTQVGRSLDHQEGTGLGLAISSRLVHLMGGTIWAESQLGQGSTFHFTIELPEIRDYQKTLVLDSSEKVSAGPELMVGPARSSDDAVSGIILVVEDNKVNSKLAERVLSKAGYKVLLAYNGVEAIAIFENQKVDLILMDLNMPVMDGIEATLKIREIASKKNRSVKIVALTANAMDDQAAICFSVGMDEFLTKPIDKTKLLSSIAQLLGYESRLSNL